MEIANFQTGVIDAPYSKLVSVIKRAIHQVSTDRPYGYDIKIDSLKNALHSVQAVANANGHKMIMGDAQQFKYLRSLLHNAA